jgi:hypothetical protein
MKRGVVITAFASSVLILTSCSSGTSGHTTSLNPGPFANQAEQVVADLAASQYQAVWQMFDATLKAQLSESALANGWQLYQERFGSYRGHGKPELIPVGSLDVEQLPMFMGKGTQEARITFEPDGAIAGLGLLKAGAPLPAAS